MMQSTLGQVMDEAKANETGGCEATPEEKSLLVADVLVGRGKLERLLKEHQEYYRLHPMTEEEKKEIDAIGGGPGIQVEELD